MTPSPTPTKSFSWKLRMTVVAIAISALVVLLRLRLLIRGSNKSATAATATDSLHGPSSGHKQYAGISASLIMRNDNRNISNKQNKQSKIHIDTEGTLWVASHSPNKDDGGSTYKDNSEKKKDTNNIRISFRLQDVTELPHPHAKFLSVPKYTCPSSVGSHPLPPSLSSPNSILNFTTSISTNLHILFMGDSVAQQFAQGFYAAVLDTTSSMGSHVILDGMEMKNRVGLHVETSLVAPTRGGGVVAYWRALSLMTEEMRGYVDYLKAKGEELRRHAYPSPSGRDANPLVNVGPDEAGNVHYRSEVLVHGMDANETTTVMRSNATMQQTFREVGNMDACILRLPHGWIQLQDMTKDHIIQHINNCHTVAGATTVIVSTLPFNNNVETASDWEQLIAINQVIRDVAHSWNPPVNGTEGIGTVLVQEFGNFTNQILWHNARHIGYNLTLPNNFATTNTNASWERTGSEFLLHRMYPDRQYAPSISMVCGQTLDRWSSRNATPPYGRACLPNMISRDGMHWCVESLGPRYSASVACLLGCVYNHNGGTMYPTEEANDDGANVEGLGLEDIRVCERECNEQFMSLVPVDESW
eukprot:CAMPEP_0183722994 /NCGR_PEP_ID=MMETSP0737-20130205/14760_1 /TAXON_ID=385413 /ORGANISM="Thalassiosira miniscula, Strain CCMP1093" /LENGTH=586 /DNA_ID=CAMNT_0025953243 /DNA_START=506 /DNA_END=2263 /DNA_ORIENTATION=-